MGMLMDVVAGLVALTAIAGLVVGVLVVAAAALQREEE